MQRETVRLRRRRCAAGAAVACATLGTLLAGTSQAQSITFGQLDNFEDGTTMGWMHGIGSPVPPTNIPDGGPNGTGDAYLQNRSTGGIGAGSRHIVFNEMQWTGNYNAAGVTRITGFMNNTGTTDLYMRVGVQGGPLSSRYVSTNAIHLAPGSGWTPVTFDLTTATMTPIFMGGEDLPTVLGSVNQLRILSAQNEPIYMGDVVAATLGIDNLRAQTRPGDANLDRVINLSDFNILASNFGTSSGATWQQADFNFDGIVNLADFNALAANFGLSFGPGDPTPGDWATLGSAVVPEPASGAVLSCAATAAIAARRRRRSRSA